MTDILGQALYDHYHKQAPAKLWINNKYGPREEMPIETYFRDDDDMPDIEWMALEECRGKILDIGAGAGSHALLLQQGGYEVTAIDISPLSVQVMKDRGVKDAHVADIFNYRGSKYDTLLLLMNGIGLAGTLHELKALLYHFKSLLNQGGQILFDSSDVSYVYEDKLPTNHYYGQIQYQYAYKKLATNWFNWLYIDEKTLQQIASETGFKREVLLEDEYGQYLARLTL